MGHPTPSSSHPAGSPLTASSVWVCASLSYAAPQPCLLACSLRSHICSQASSAQPELAPALVPTPHPSSQWPFQHGDCPSKLTQHQRPVGSVCPVHPQVTGTFHAGPQPARSLCPLAVWSPRGNDFPVGRPSPFFTSHTAAETACSHFEARAAHKERPSIFC